MLYKTQEQFLLNITLLHLCPFWGTAQQKVHADILESSQSGSNEIRGLENWTMRKG